MFDLQGFNLLNSDEVTIWNALLKITQTILNVVFNQNMTGQNKVIPQKKKIKNQQQIKKKKKKTKQKYDQCLNCHAKIYTALKGICYFSSYIKQLRDFQCHFNFLHCKMK